MAHRKKSSGITFDEWQLAVADAERGSNIPENWICTADLAKEWGVTRSGAASILQNIRSTSTTKIKCQIHNKTFWYDPSIKNYYTIATDTPGTTWKTVEQLSKIWKITNNSARARLKKLLELKLVKSKFFKIKYNRSSHFAVHYQLTKKYLS